VPGRVECASWWFKAHLATELLYVSKDIPPAQLGPVPCCKHKPIARRICDVADQTLAYFGTEGHDSRLAALPVQPHQQNCWVNPVTPLKQSGPDSSPRLASI
jgi:hypothetical protein